LEKIGEKIENSKSEISNILEEKIKNLISENDISINFILIPHTFIFT
jgi:hypothetical protein